LDEHEAPKLILEPVEVLLAAFFGALVGPARAFERIKAEICNVRNVRVRFLA
jgi:hypothetical protein